MGERRSSKERESTAAITGNSFQENDSMNDRTEVAKAEQQQPAEQVGEQYTETRPGGHSEMKKSLTFGSDEPVEQDQKAEAPDEEEENNYSDGDNSPKLKKTTTYGEDEFEQDDGGAVGQTSN